MKSPAKFFKKSQLQICSSWSVKFGRTIWELQSQLYSQKLRITMNKKFVQVWIDLEMSSMLNSTQKNILVCISLICQHQLLTKWGSVEYFLCCMTEEVVATLDVWKERNLHKLCQILIKKSHWKGRYHILVQVTTAVHTNFYFCYHNLVCVKYEVLGVKVNQATMFTC